MLLAAMALGAGLGLGALLVGRGLFPARPPLAAVFAELHRPPGKVSQGDRWERRAQRLARRLEAAGDGGRLATDLAVTGRSPERHALDKLAAAAAGLVLPPLSATAMWAGGAAVAPGAVVAAAVTLTVGGFVSPDVLLRNQAAAARRDFRHALGAYLDLVTIVLAGGGGVETALIRAADTGSGWVFDRLRMAAERARRDGIAPWDVLRRLGEELGVDELVELGASMTLAGQEGATVRSSLAAKAVTLREHLQADAKAKAESASEQMAGPTVALLIGFVLLVIYPAVAKVLAI